MWLLGLGSVFSFNILADYHPLSFMAKFDGMTIYDCFDYIMSNMLLPIGAFLTAIFVGWVASREEIRKELGLPDGLAFKLWRVLIRFVVPLGVAAIFIGGLVA